MLSLIKHTEIGPALSFITLITKLEQRLNLNLSLLWAGDAT